MATTKAIITQSYLTDIANAIISKGGATTALRPPQMAAAIRGLQTLPDGWIIDGDQVVKVKTVPQFCLNFYKDAQAAGWVNHTQRGGSTIPPSGQTLTENGITFSTSAGGNFFDNNWSEVNTDFDPGSYVDIYGVAHSNLIDEIRMSTSLPSTTEFGTQVYKTGLMNGGFPNHLVTLSGLTPSQKYVVYLGFGLRKNDDANQVCGMTLHSTSYDSVEKLEYVVSANGNNTTKANSYTQFNFTTEIAVAPGVNGLMVVRMTGVSPKSDGTINFNFGVRGGMNWMIVAKVK